MKYWLGAHQDEEKSDRNDRVYLKMHLFLLTIIDGGTDAILKHFAWDSKTKQKSTQQGAETEDSAVDEEM